MRLDVGLERHRAERQLLDLAPDLAPDGLRRAVERVAQAAVHAPAPRDVRGRRSGSTCTTSAVRLSTSNVPLRSTIRPRGASTFTSRTRLSFASARYLSPDSTCRYHRRKKIDREQHQRDAAEDRHAQRELRRDDHALVALRQVHQRAPSSARAPCAGHRPAARPQVVDQVGPQHGAHGREHRDRQQAVDHGADERLPDHERAHRRVHAEQELHEREAGVEPERRRGTRRSAARACGWRRASRGSGPPDSRRRSAAASSRPASAAAPCPRPGRAGSPPSRPATGPASRPIESATSGSRSALASNTTICATTAICSTTTAITKSVSRTQVPQVTFMGSSCAFCTAPRVAGQHLDHVELAQVRERLQVHALVQLPLVGVHSRHAPDRDAAREQRLEPRRRATRT